MAWTHLYNRVILGTNTDSTTTSEDDRVPPPLPAKHRELDYSNLPNEVTTDSPCSTPPRNASTPPPHRLADKVKIILFLLLYYTWSKRKYLRLCVFGSSRNKISWRLNRAMNSHRRRHRRNQLIGLITRWSSDETIDWIKFQNLYIFFSLSSYLSPICKRK